MSNGHSIFKTRSVMIDDDILAYQFKTSCKGENRKVLYYLLEELCRSINLTLYFLRNVWKINWKIKMMWLTMLQQHICSIKSSMSSKLFRDYWQQKLRTRWSSGNTVWWEKKLMIGFSISKRKNSFNRHSSISHSYVNHIW